MRDARGDSMAERVSTGHVAVIPAAAVFEVEPVAAGRVRVVCRSCRRDVELSRWTTAAALFHGAGCAVLEVLTSNTAGVPVRFRMGPRLLALAHHEEVLQ